MSVTIETYQSAISPGTGIAGKVELLFRGTSEAALRTLANIARLLNAFTTPREDTWSKVGKEWFLVL